MVLRRKYMKSGMNIMLMKCMCAYADAMWKLLKANTTPAKNAAYLFFMT